MYLSLELVTIESSFIMLNLFSLLDAICYYEIGSFSKRALIVSYLVLVSVSIIHWILSFYIQIKRINPNVY